MQDSKKPRTLKEASAETGKLIKNERKRHEARIAQGRKLAAKAMRGPSSKVRLP